MVHINGYLDLNLENDEYQKVKAISKSRLTTATISMEKFYDTYEAPDREEPQSAKALEFGSALHTMILEPWKFESTYLVVPKVDKRTKQGKIDAESYEEMAQAEGKILLLDQDAMACERIRAKIYEHPTVGPLLKASPLRETSFFWTDPETGLACKCRTDHLDLEHRIIIDAKSARNLEDHRIEGANWEYKYHFTPPHYAAGIENVTGEVIEAYIFMAFEKERPFGVKLFTLDALSLQAGLNHTRQLMRDLAECYDTGIWPGYPTEIRTIGLPRYALSQYGFDLKKAHQDGTY